MPERQSARDDNRRGAWALAGLLAGLAGLATSYLTAALLGLRGNPVTDVAELRDPADARARWPSS